MSDFTAPGTAAQLEHDDPAPGADPTPDLDLTVGEESSDLDALGDDLAPVTTEPVDLEVPLRPMFTVKCRTDFTGKDLDKWRKAARDKSFVEGIDGVKFSALIIGATCTAILRNGNPVLSQGDTVTFGTAEFRGTLGTRDVEQAVRRFFGQEGHVDGAARRLLNEAGWGEEVYTVDPTTA